jgi:SAM-dependent methyltransferase
MVVSSAEVVWHDLECGSYRADLPLWRELAEQAAIGERPARILDVGAGAGRVALELARSGHQVTALDLDPALLGALRERAAETNIQTVCADARTFELARGDFDLCMVAMQTVQLLGGRAGRIAFLRRAHAHLRPEGLLALAIVTAIEAFDCAEDDIGPTAEVARLDGVLYRSRATRVSVLQESILIERERRINSDAGQADEPGVEPMAERNAIELDLLSAEELEREAIEAGLHPEPARALEPTRDHVGSTVVMLRA